MLVRSVHAAELAGSVCLPILSVPVSAGFPSPADDYLQSELNLQDALIHHPVATFFMRVEGDSMTGCGIFSGDLLVVDRSVDPVEGAVVIAVLDGEFTVKRFRRSQGRIRYTNTDLTSNNSSIANSFIIYTWHSRNKK